MDLIVEARDLLLQTQEGNGTPYITSYEIENIDKNIQNALQLLNQFISLLSPLSPESDIQSEMNRMEFETYETCSLVPHK